jgi:hypothetical protein
MANDEPTTETVFVSLDWTHGVNVDGRTVYFGPGERVPVPTAVAEAKGWKLRSQADEVRAQTVGEIASEFRAKTPTSTDVTSLAGVPHLVDALEIAGFVTAVSIRDATEADLTAVSGIGEATAAKLRTAAEELLS